MSKIRKDLIHDEFSVMSLIRKIGEENSWVKEAYLIGSRAKSEPVEDGKDWDFLILAKFPVVKAKAAFCEGYHVDLVVTSEPSNLENFQHRKLIAERRESKWVLLTLPNVAKSQSSIASLLTRLAGMVSRIL